MNNGKICISLCANTADTLFEQIGRAEPLADVIEVRFDCLDPDAISSTLTKLTDWVEHHPEKLLSTFRDIGQGGKREITLDERREFWFTGYDTILGIGDFEEDIIEESLDWLYFDRICSYHDFSPQPPDVVSILKRLDETDATVIKIAVMANEITDTIPLWNLLIDRKPDEKPLIPIAMGEAGKWTRILGAAHGAYMTYASLEADAETAPGQISADDMIDVFRVKELSRSTQVYGIVAGNTSYSVSPWMHNAAFKTAGMDRVFVPLQVADLDGFIRRMVDPETREIDLNFAGFSVTNPHKQSIMLHLDEIDETAATIGAVNTVKLEDGRLYGYNTDAPGFIAPLIAKLGNLKGSRAAIVGAGGAARACIYALRNDGADVTLFARDPQKAAPLAEEFGIGQSEISNLKSEISDFDILVNTTPLGTKGENEDKTIAIAEQLKGLKLVYDLNYNPAETRLLREAERAGTPSIGGMDMLIAQGAKQFEIWTGDAAPIDAMTEAVKKRMQ